MSETKRRTVQVHGTKGAYVGGDWVPLEECADKFNIKGGSGGEDCGNKCATCPRSRSRKSAAKADGSYDIAIIGAGAIGCSIARELSKSTASIILLEAADDVTQGATKGNSGIVHAGYDDKPGSVKAKYCWPGNQLMPQLDRELHFGYQKNGSLVVAKGKEDEAILQELLQRADKNNVKNLQILDEKALRAKEPYIHEDATAALYSPDAGSLIPYEYAIALAENAVDNGVELRIRREVVDIKKQTAGGFVITAKHWEPMDVAAKYLGKKRGGLVYNAVLLLVSLGISVFIAPLVQDTVPTSVFASLTGEGFMALLSIVVALVVIFLAKVIVPNDTSHLEDRSYSPSKGTTLYGKSTTEVIKARYIVNAAGCTSDEIAKMVGDTSFKVKRRMGEYILLHKKENFRCVHTLFPTPHPVYGKGVLVQNTLWGNLILGPTARDTLQKNSKTGLYEINPAVRDEPVENIMGYILSKCRNLVPSFDPSQVIHTFSGARSKNTTGDWIIGPVEGVNGFINAASIDSPGIAASPAIAKDIVKFLKQAGCELKPDPKFNPNRAPIIRPKSGFKGLKLSPADRKGDWFKEQDPKKNVICKCEKVTEAEIIEALHRSLPIDSTQAIRKRTRAGMGHCQGDPSNYDCETRVAMIIARELGCSVDEIPRRQFPASSMLPRRWITETDKNKLVELSDPKKQYKLHGAA